MRIARHVLALTVLLAGGVACTSPSEPLVVGTVRVPDEELLATRVVEGAATFLSFTIPVTVDNQGTAAFSYAYCAASLDALVNTRWTRVWDAGCLGPADVLIPAGTAREIAIAVRLPIGGADAPPGIETPGTRYRAVLGLMPAVLVDGARPRLASNSFTVRERP